MSHPATPRFQQAHEFVETTYSGSLSIIASLQRALDDIAKGTDLGAETAELLGKAQQVTRMLAELERDISKLNNLCKESGTHLDLVYMRPSTWLLYGRS